MTASEPNRQTKLTRKEANFFPVRCASAQMKVASPSVTKASLAVETNGLLFLCLEQKQCMFVNRYLPYGHLTHVSPLFVELRSITAKKPDARWFISGYHYSLDFKIFNTCTLNANKATKTTEADKGVSLNIFEIPKNLSNPNRHFFFKSLLNSLSNLKSYYKS